MNQPKLTAEVFTFPYKGKHVIYAPFQQVMLLVNETMVNLLVDIRDGTYHGNGSEDEAKIIKFLKERRIVDGPEEKPPVAPNSRHFNQPESRSSRPTSATCAVFIAMPQPGR